MMLSLVSYALPGIIVASALGAVIMCLLVFRYGFSAAEEDPDDAAHRLFVTRFWHALAGVCFAVAAILAVVAWSARPLTPVPLAASGETVAHGAGERIGTLDAEVRRLEQRLTSEVAALEGRLGAIEMAAAERRRAAEQPPDEPTARAPAPSAAPPVARAPVASRAARPRRDRDEDRPAALPADAGPPQLRATLHGVHVDVRSRRGPGQEMVYTVRLSDAAGRALSGADVTLVGQTAGGATFRAVLQPTTTAGVYRGRAARENDGPTDLRLRVVRRDKRFELPLAHGVSW